MERNDENSNCLGFNFEPEAVIVGGGDYPTHSLPLGFVHNVEKLVCCDGTANQWLNKSKRPWAIVGDGDSLSDEARKVFADIIHLNPDQETNDQTKAVHFITQQGLKRMAIVAATGRREDHTLGNISLLIEYMREGLDVRIFTDYGVFIPCHDSQTFCCPIGTAVSFFNVDATGVTSEGLAYSLYDTNRLWQGTLNHTTAKKFTITCKGDYMVFLNYENKKIRE